MNKKALKDLLFKMWFEAPHVQGNSDHEFIFIYKKSASKAAFFNENKSFSVKLHQCQGHITKQDIIIFVKQC